MSLSDAHPWLQRTAQAVAVATLVASGTTIVHNKIDNVRQDEQLKQVEGLTEKLDSFNEKLVETDKNLAILNERLKRILEDT